MTPLTICPHFRARKAASSPYVMSKGTEINIAAVRRSRQVNGPRPATAGTDDESRADMSKNFVPYADSPWKSSNPTNKKRFRRCTCAVHRCGYISHKIVADRQRHTTRTWCTPRVDGAGLKAESLTVKTDRARTLAPRAWPPNARHRFGTIHAFFHQPGRHPQRPHCPAPRGLAMKIIGLPRRKGCPTTRAQ